MRTDSNYKNWFSLKRRKIIATKEEIKEFRDGIFALRTRRFGTVAEIMIKHLYNMSEAHNLAFDKYSETEGRVEVKFSTVMKENDDKIRDTNVIEQCKKANLANRAMVSDDIDKGIPFDCNIQQVKTNEFQVLYYGLFFADCVEIFEMTREQVLLCPGYSNKQHRGNEGEGQFHINQGTIQFHKNHYFKKCLSYEELYELFENI